MNRFSFVCLLLFSLFPAHAQPGQSNIAIRNVNVIDVAGGKVSAGQTVLIRNGNIDAVGPAEAVPVSPATNIVEGYGFYLIPGLWDMHVHFRNNPVDRYKPIADENAAMLDLFVANGVVGVREMGGDLSDHVLQWRDQIREGKRVGPRILTPGRKLDVATPAWPGSIAVTSPDEARQAVQRMKRVKAG